ncbi:MAG: DUF1080 domain-containing protein [Bacteroidetes bacterium]|nr:DUF1080 domain-containing protein [Bacteroidota bacterium]MDA1121388.1 DUF1080 domain-containing protein [Bacteroidota bacterium]
MKNLRFDLSIALIIILGISCSKPGSTDQEEVILFAENAQDWIKGGDADWTFVNNELIGRLDSGQGFVVTKKAYKDFALTVEFYPDDTINSGVFLRCKNAGLSGEDCYELNIWDDNPNQEYRTGAIFLRSNPLAQVETINQWNTYELRCEGDRIQASINGVVTADLRDQSRAEGFIALQARGIGEIRFRNVKVRPLE